MAPRFDGHASSPAGDEEIVQFGSRRPRSRRWLGPLALTFVVIAAIAIVATHHVRHPRGHRASPPAVTTVRLGPRQLGVTADWELFGLDGGSVVSVQFARGVITRTALPPIDSTGPVSFVVGPGDVIVRPLDFVPGYVIPDGKPAKGLSGLLDSGGVLLPGPVLADHWLVTNSRVILVGADGRPTGKQITGIPLHWQLLSATSDGRGELLLFSDTGTAYEAAPGVLRRVPMIPLAVGPTTWFGLTCHKGGCRNVVITVATGARRQLPGRPLADLSIGSGVAAVPGLVAPNGSTAAVLMSSERAGGPAMLDLVNLTSGKVTQVGMPLAADESAQQLAWSPDSRWLFVVTASGHLAAVNPHTGFALGVVLGLSGLSQIVIRPTGAGGA